MSCFSLLCDYAWKLSVMLALFYVSVKLWRWGREKKFSCSSEWASFLLHPLRSILCMLLRGVDWEGYNLICLYTGGWSQSLPLTSTLYGDLKHHKTQPWASAAGCIQCTVLLCPLSLCTATCTGESDGKKQINNNW